MVCTLSVTFSLGIVDLTSTWNSCFYKYNFWNNIVFFFITYIVFLQCTCNVPNPHLDYCFRDGALWNQPDFPIDAFKGKRNSNREKQNNSI